MFAQAGDQVVSPSITIDALIDASGKIAAVGGTARAAYLNPLDITELHLEPAWWAQLAHAVGHVGLIGVLRRISGRVENDGARRGVGAS